MNLLLAAIWPQFRAASDAYRRLDDENIDALLGCYNLGSVTDRSMFWRQGDDSHREAWRAMVRLIVAYADGIDDQVQPTGGQAAYSGRCDGFAEFVRGVLQGRRMLDSLGKRCALTVNFNSEDRRFYTTATSRCTSEEKSCGQWFSVDEDGVRRGVPFDEQWSQWENSWDTSSRTYRCDDGGYWPDTGTNLLAIGGGFGMTVHPILLASAGFTADRILHRARIAFDYSQYSSDETYRTHAVQLGRYALSALVPLARVMIHEIGHSYMGAAGHCEFGCCFDLASQAWVCHVQGALGLPLALNYDDHTLAEFTSGSFTSSTARLAKLDHEFGGGEVRATLKKTDIACSSATPWWWSLDRSVDVTSSTGNICWTCTIDRAGEAGAHGDFCLNRAWQVFEGTIRPWGGPTRALDKVDEWAVTHPCPLPALSDVEEWADRAWCWSEE